MGCDPQPATPNPPPVLDALCLPPSGQAGLKQVSVQTARLLSTDGLNRCYIHNLRFTDNLFTVLEVLMLCVCLSEKFVLI